MENSKKYKNVKINYEINQKKIKNKNKEKKKYPENKKWPSKRAKENENEPINAKSHPHFKVKDPTFPCKIFVIWNYVIFQN